MAYKKAATGRARCWECNELIEKGTIDVIFPTYSFLSHYHFLCVRDILNKEISR
jgi:hypothetical protein